MHNNQDVEVFDPATPPGGQATTVVSQLPPDRPASRTPYPWPNHEGLGLYPHMFVLPDTTGLGDGGDKVLVAGPSKYDSAVIDTDTWVWTDVLDRSVPDTGQPRSPADRSWGTAWLEPSGPTAPPGSCCSGGSDAGRRSPASRHQPAAPGDRRGARPRRARRAAGSSTRTSTSNEGARALQQRAAARRLDLHQRRRLRPALNDTLYADPVYDARAAARPAAPAAGAGGRRGRRPHATTRPPCCCRTAAWCRPATTATSSRAGPGGSPATCPGHIALQSRTAQIWSPPYLFDGQRPVVTFAPDRRALRRPLPHRGRRATLRDHPGRT